MPAQAPVIINGFSLEPRKLDGVLPLTKQYDADIIGYVLAEDSRVPMDEDEMMSAAVALFEAYTNAGLPPRKLIIDPVVVPVTWPDGLRHNRGVLTLIRRLPDLLGTTVRTIAGLSNLSSGSGPLGRKIALETAYLPMLRRRRPGYGADQHPSFPDLDHCQIMWGTVK